MNCIKKIIFAFVIILAFVLTAKPAFASEGTIELRPTSNNTFRCYAASIQMLSLNYKVLITCRDLLYPAGEDIFIYMLWASPVDGGNPIKFGQLGLGRAEFRTGKSFSNLFVTTEKNNKTRKPEGLTVMKGSVNKISFLEGPKTPDLDEKLEPPEEAIPSPAPSTRSKLITGIKRAAVVSLIAFSALLALIFVLTRKR